MMNFIERWHWYVSDRGDYYSTETKAFTSEAPAEFSTVQNVSELVAALDRNGRIDLAPVSETHIKRECQRRIISLLGAKDLNDCFVKQFNANMRATELVDKMVQGQPLTDQEIAESSALRSLAAEIKRLRAKSNELELILPDDYASDARWS